MATKEIVVMVCDLCGGDDLVTTHTMVVDGEAIVFETCDKCWAEQVLPPFAALAKAGRKPEPATKVSKRGNVKTMPGTEWKFTSHALLRMGERHIDPTEAVEAADYPEVTRPAREPGLQLRALHGVKVVVNESRRIIVTVAKRDEEVEHVA